MDFLDSCGRRSWSGVLCVVTLLLGKAVGEVTAQNPHRTEKSEDTMGGGGKKGGKESS